MICIHFFLLFFPRFGQVCYVHQLYVIVRHLYVIGKSLLIRATV